VKHRGAARIGAVAGVAVAIAVGAGPAQAVSLPDADTVVQGGATLPPLPSVDPAEFAQALTDAGGRPRKLRKRSPGWFGRAEERRLRGKRSKTQAPADAPVPGQVGIRPGSMMISPFICTMNYIFRKGDTLAIGTAGHCLEGGERVVLLTLAPTGGDPVLVELGKTLLRRDGGIGHDYGLVKVPAARHDWVFPTIAGVGGPCGEYAGGDPQPVAHYGHGLVGGNGGTPRAGMGVESDVPRGFDLEWDSDSYSWLGELSNGDSGSPVRIAQLGAVGNLTHGLGVDLPVPQPSVLGWGTRITKITGQGWTLVDSPLCPP
jgi:hypothetical protein